MFDSHYHAVQCLCRIAVITACILGISHYLGIDAFLPEIVLLGIFENRCKNGLISKLGAAFALIFPLS
mgnify:CR=1 FL=1